MRIAVYGAGGYFGAQLARTGEDVIFIARGEHLRAIREHGLQIETPEGELRIRPALATADPAEAGSVDAVLLGVKAWQVKDAAAAMRPLIGADTIVVPLQNGVEAPAQLAAVLGNDHVLGGLCGTFSWVTAPGRIRSIGTSNFIRFGELDGRSTARAEKLRAAFTRAGVRAEIPADIGRALWEKFLLVSSFGGIGAVSRAPIGVIRAVPQTRALLEACIGEARAVGCAHGVALPDGAVAETMALLDALPPAATTSMQRDIAAGRPSELEAWTGAVVRLGKGLGVPTPHHAAIYAGLLPLELQARGEVVYPG